MERLSKALQFAAQAKKPKREGVIPTTEAISKIVPESRNVIDMNGNGLMFLQQKKETEQGTEASSKRESVAELSQWKVMWTGRWPGGSRLNWLERGS